MSLPIPFFLLWSQSFIVFVSMQSALVPSCNVMCLQLVNLPLCHWGMPNCRPNTATIIQAVPSPLIVKACKHGFKSQGFYQLSEFGQSIQLAEWLESISFDWQLVNYPTCMSFRQGSGPCSLVLYLYLQSDRKHFLANEAHFRNGHQPLLGHPPSA